MFDSDKEKNQGKKKKNKKVPKLGTTSESTYTQKSDSSQNKSIEYSLNDIAKLDTFDLKTLIFTFDKKLASSKDLTKINDNDKNLDRTIRSLKCMRGIDEEFIPTFKFFQFKKSNIKDPTAGLADQTMLCFNDIS